MMDVHIRIAPCTCNTMSKHCFIELDTSHRTIHSQSLINAFHNNIYKVRETDCNKTKSYVHESKKYNTPQASIKACKMSLYGLVYLPGVYPQRFRGANTSASLYIGHKRLSLHIHSEWVEHLPRSHKVTNIRDEEGLHCGVRVVC